MGIKTFLFAFLSLFIFGCASQQQSPTGKPEDWVTVTDAHNIPVAGFDKAKGDVKLYSSGEDAFRAMVGVLGAYSQQCPCAPKDAKAETKDKKKQHAKKSEKKSEPKTEVPLMSPSEEKK